MWKLVLSLLIGFLAITAEAEVQIIDELGLLQRIQQMYRGAYSFEQAFACGDEQKFRANTTTCTYKCGRACASTCNEAVSPVQKKFVLGVEECSSDRVMIYGDNGFSMEVHKSDYDLGGRSLIVPLLKAHGFFANPENDVQLSFSSIVGVKVLENGREVQKMAVRLSADAGVSQFGQGFNLEILWFPEERGLKSLAIFRTGMFDYFLRRNDVRETMPGFNM